MAEKELQETIALLLHNGMAILGIISVVMVGKFLLWRLRAKHLKALRGR